jgi:hypothetical protein
MSYRIAKRLILKTMSKYFIINGYWKDIKSEFSGYIVKEDFDIVHDEEDDIFFYGLSESDIIEAIESIDDTVHDFVITSYEEIIL